MCCFLLAIVDGVLAAVVGEVALIEGDVDRVTVLVDVWRCLSAQGDDNGGAECAFIVELKINLESTRIKTQC